MHAMDAGETSTLDHARHTIEPDKRRIISKYE